MMRRYFSVVLCGILLSACTVGIVNVNSLTPAPSPSATPTPLPSWHITTVDGKGGFAVAMALNREGYPQFAYEARTPNQQHNLLHTRWDGKAWKKESVAAMDLGGEVSLTLDSNDAPIISFSACSEFYCAPKYAEWAGGGWVIADLPDLISHVALQVDVNGILHIGYESGNVAGQVQLEYAYREANTWVTQTLAHGTEDYLPSLKLDQEGNPHLSYRSQSGLVYTYWTGQEWRKWTVDDTEGAGWGHALALDTHGYPHLSYYEGDGGLSYAAWDGQHWTIQIVDSEVDGENGCTAIAVDALGNPHIAYSDDTENGAVKYAHWTGGAWSIETVATNVGESPNVSLALDSFQQPHIGFNAYDGRDISIRYAYRTVSQY